MSTNTSKVGQANKDVEAKESVVSGKEFTTNDEYMSIKMIMNEYNLTHVYVSRAVQKGWLKPVEKVAINKSETQFKYVVKRSVVEAWRRRCGAKARRTDGRRKFVHYMTPKEHAELEKVKKENEILKKTILQLANPPKNS